MRSVQAGLAVLALFAMVAPASAKEDLPRKVVFCGSSGCRTITAREVMYAMPFAVDVPRPSLPPARPSAYYTFRETFVGGGVSPLGYYLPRSGILRTQGADRALWRSPGSALRSSESMQSIFRAAVRGIDPFPAPRITRVTVGMRNASDPSSYLRLYRLHGVGRAPIDPAGRLPPPHTAAYWDVAAYFAAVRRYWIPVNLWTRRPSPWGDGGNFVWVSKRGSLLKRDGELLRIAPALAERIRRGASLR